MSSRGMPVTKQMRAERRKRAEEMKAEYDKLSLQEKLDRLPLDGAKKQRTRLAAKIEAAKAAAASKVEAKKESK